METLVLKNSNTNESKILESIMSRIQDFAMSEIFYNPTQYSGKCQLDKFSPFLYMSLFYFQRNGSNIVCNIPT